jgi:hypothetical protein
MIKSKESSNMKTTTTTTTTTTTSIFKALKRNSASRKSERGNVLFLILIAVALFAALSYAVTSSSRSGGGDASSETNLVSSAAITQYPASVRTSIVRMIISSTTADTLAFDPPPFAACTGADLARCVFHPSGGGATHVNAPSDVMADGVQGDWTMNGDFEIINIGTSAAGSDGNEIIAFLYGVKEGICSKINDELGFGATPVITATVAGADPATAGYLRIMDTGLSFAAGQTVLGTGGAAGSDIANFDGQPFGCFRNTASGDFVYYHVLVER